MKNPLKFIQEVKQEAFKVTWPTGKETIQGSLMVVAMAIIASIFFLLLDQVLKFLLEVLLRGVERTDVERGQVLAQPGSVTPHTKFEAQAYVLKKEEGGRHTPFFSKYRPQFYFRTTDVTGEVELAKGTEMVMPGDDAKFTVKLITPIAMNEKLNFAIREGGKTVGAGVVTKILE